MPASSAATTAPESCCAGQAAGLGAEQVEGADVLAGDDDGHRVHAADLQVQHRRAVDGPALLVGVGEID